MFFSPWITAMDSQGLNCSVMHEVQNMGARLSFLSTLPDQKCMPTQYILVIQDPKSQTTFL